MLFSVAEAITGGADDKVLSQWRKLSLMVSMVFEAVAPGADRFWGAQNLREDMVEAGESAR
eukprot:9004631-Lingulodinium_polyedra.AAC.1